MGEIEVRRVQATDIPEMVRGARAFYDHGNFIARGLPFSRCGFSHTVLNFLDEQLICMLIAVKDGVSVGSVAASAFPWFLDPECLMVQELWWWVDREHRGVVGKMMLKEMETWAKQLRADHFIMVSLADGNSERMHRLYSRMGYAPMEVHYHKELK